MSNWWTISKLKKWLRPNNVPSANLGNLVIFFHAYSGLHLQGKYKVYQTKGLAKQKLQAQKHSSKSRKSRHPETINSVQNIIKHPIKEKIIILSPNCESGPRSGWSPSCENGDSQNTTETKIAAPEGGKRSYRALLAGARVDFTGRLKQGWSPVVAGGRGRVGLQKNGHSREEQ